jgi:hypothetical protein
MLVRLLEERCGINAKRLILMHSMRNLFSIARGGVLLFVAFTMSSCASGDMGVASKNQQPPSNEGITIGPATVAPGTSEFESPWPFGPLGMDED